MSVTAFDHVAIPIEKVDEMLEFYRQLGFRVTDTTAPIYSVHFGNNKINFHDPEIWKSGKFDLRGPTAQPGCGDFCFVWSGTSAELSGHLSRLGAEVIEGPIERPGGRADGSAIGTSVYIRDPDSNLLEFMIYP